MLDNNLLRQIAEELEMGMIVWLDPKTGVYYAVPDPMRDMDYDPSNWQDALDEIDAHEGELVRLTGMGSRESFQIMEAFAETVSDPHLQQQLLDALSRSKPFRRFKDIVDDADAYRQRWFDFRDEKWIEWTRQAIAAATLGRLL